MLYCHYCTAWVLKCVAPFCVNLHNQWKYRRENFEFCSSKKVCLNSIFDLNRVIGCIMLLTFMLHSRRVLRLAPVFIPQQPELLTLGDDMHVGFASSTYCTTYSAPNTFTLKKTLIGNR